jgi:hypothetical protein
MQKKALSVTIVLMFLSSILHAQIEVAHLRTKDFSATGFGAFLNFAVPVTEYGSLTAEAAFYYFKKDDNNVALVPFLLGYRHMLQEPDAGFYIEPNAGYNIGATDIQKYSENGSPLYEPNGEPLEQQVKGFTAGIGTGYIFPGNFSFNIGLRYQRVFVSGEPAMNLFSLRLSHPLSFRRRDY